MKDILDKILTSFLMLLICAAFFIAVLIALLLATITPLN